MEISEKNILNDISLINLIKENFNETENKLFELSFTMFITTQNNPDDFIINLDDIYKWIGFNRKDNAKTLLIKNFKKDIDYSIFLFKQKNSKGRPSEKILLKIDTFKEYCLLAATEESKKIYKYFIKMEKIIFKYLQEKYNNQLNIIQEKNKALENNKLLLEEKEKIIKEKEEELKNIKNIKYKEVIKTGSIYIFSTDKEGIYKCGRSIKPINRKKSLQTGLVDDIEILYEYNTCDDKLLEYIIHNILDKYRINEREHFECNIEYMKSIIKITGNIIDILKSTYQYITEKEILEKIINIIIEEKPDIKIQIDNKKNNTNTSLLFMEECTEQSNTHIHTSKLYESYKKWFSNNYPDDKLISNRAFINNIKTKYKLYDNVRVPGITSPSTGFKYIALKNNNSQDLFSD